MNKKILVVDDEPDILKVITFRLKKINCEIFTAIDGLDALKIAQEIKPDIILLDILLPNMDGREVCLNIKNNPELKNIPIIFMTASAISDTVRIMKECFADDYLIKPFEPEELFEKVKKYIG
ncbi:MAG: response regulator [Candidatus Omnitrophota bacterium]